jgi:hypothetical protein
MSTAALRLFWWILMDGYWLLWVAMDATGIQLDFLPTASGLSLGRRGSAWETYALKIAARSVPNLISFETSGNVGHPQKNRWQKHVYNCITQISITITQDSSVFFPPSRLVIQSNFQLTSICRLAQKPPGHVSKWPAGDNIMSYAVGMQ